MTGTEFRSIRDGNRAYDIGREKLCVVEQLLRRFFPATTLRLGDYILLIDHKHPLTHQVFAIELAVEPGGQFRLVDIHGQGDGGPVYLSASSSPDAIALWVLKAIIDKP